MALVIRFDYYKRSKYQARPEVSQNRCDQAQSGFRTLNA